MVFPSKTTLCPKVSGEQVVTPLVPDNSFSHLTQSADTAAFESSLNARDIQRTTERLASVATQDGIKRLGL